MSGDNALRVLLLFAIVLSLQFVGVWVSVKLIAWSKAFFDALENRDVREVVFQLGRFGLFIGISAFSFLIGDWLRKRLYLRLRQRLTEYTQSCWLSQKAFWHLRPGYSSGTVDNPDQRISEDCRLFVNRLLLETLDLITSAVALVSYVGVLWSLSTIPLTLTVLGYELSIPRYMVWSAFIYVAAAVTVTHLLGKPLKNLVFDQERREADFRHALIQLREGADEVAQSSGEDAEKQRLNRRFDEIRYNWYRLSNAEFMLGLFTRPYFMTVLRIPMFLALPAYFFGGLTLGGLMQLASAFSQVTTTLSWFIFNYKELAEFVAVSERLDRLLEMSRNPPLITGARKDIRRCNNADGRLKIQGLELQKPSGHTILTVPDISLEHGGVLWIRGASGIGKSTLLAAIAGLWPYGTGLINLPAGKKLALPQVPRVFPESFLHAACYPFDPDKIGKHEIEAAIAQVGLSHRIAALDKQGSEGTVGLSIGERQRLAICRVLISKPDFLILDEATSALDQSAEIQIYRTIRAAIPLSTIVCAAHRPPDALGVDQVVGLGDLPD